MLTATVVVIVFKATTYYSLINGSSFTLSNMRTTATTIIAVVKIELDITEDTQKQLRFL